mmetsp:Transcript_22664/g.52905  ORF Transcript_22664/g.52905 Transcript_22664/m.52905 type:complete len:529 (-) Transcript_22664:5-1591(-)
MEAVLSSTDRHGPPAVSPILLQKLGAPVVLPGAAGAVSLSSRPQQAMSTRIVQSHRDAGESLSCLLYNENCIRYLQTRWRGRAPPFVHNRPAGLLCALGALGAASAGCASTSNARPKSRRQRGKTRSAILAGKLRRCCQPSTVTEVRPQQKLGKVYLALTNDAGAITQASLLANLQRLGLSHYGAAEVDRVWTHLAGHVPGGVWNRGISEEELEVASQTSDLISALLVQVREHLALRKFQVEDSYDYHLPTSCNYAAPVEEGFHGPYTQERLGGTPPRARDYNYHRNYVRRRQEWQDRVVRLTVARCQPQERPCIIFACGAMGSGKGYTLQKMSEVGHFPMEEMVRIDPDHFKSLMPEWKGYVRSGKCAGSLTHLESCYLQEICQEVALRRSQHIWVDGSLRDTEWFKKLFTDIRENFPQYQIGIVHVHASEAIVRQRIKDREAKTGRGIPEELIQRSLEAPQQSLFHLAGMCDWIATVDNEYVPRLTHWARVDRSGNWEQVSEQCFGLGPIAEAIPRKWNCTNGFGR